MRKACRASAPKTKINFDKTVAKDFIFALFSLTHPFSLTFRDRSFYTFFRTHTGLFSHAFSLSLRPPPPPLPLPHSLSLLCYPSIDIPYRTSSSSRTYLLSHTSFQLPIMVFILVQQYSPFNLYNSITNRLMRFS